MFFVILCLNKFWKSLNLIIVNKHFCLHLNYCTKLIYDMNYYLLQTVAFIQEAWDGFKYEIDNC